MTAEDALAILFLIALTLAAGLILAGKL